MSGWNLTRKDYTKKGIKNKRMNNKFIKICKLNKVQLKRYLENELKKYYKNVISQEGFLYVKGRDKICLTAHMDTVHKDVVSEYYVLKEGKKTIVSSPQGIGGDDRCGIFMILKILERTTYRPTIVFCEDEEVGGVGSRKFCNTKFIKDLEKMYFLIELDRMGSNDLVYYQDENKIFHKFAEEVTGYIQNWGSFSDISNLSPACKVSSVNISCGYYNAHRNEEYVVMEEMENSIKATIKLIEAGLEKKEQFKYKKREYETHTYRGFSNGYEYYTPRNWITNNRWDEKKKKDITLYIQYMKNGVECDDALYGEDEDALWGEFFKEHGDVCFNDVLDYEVYEDEDLIDCKEDDEYDEYNNLIKKYTENTP